MASTLQNLLKNKAEKDKAKELAKPKLEIVESNSGVTVTPPKQTQPVPTTTDHYQVLPTPTKSTSQTPTSPAKNYTKVPNSITSEAIPQGMFKGLSKHTYDVLYKLTRGAINPVREIQLTRLDLMKLTGLSENTQRAHIKYLSMTGLLKVSYQTGKHEGATYEVFIPEELNSSTPPNPSQVVPSTTNQYQPQVSSSNDYQNLVPDTSQNLVGVSTTNTIENKDTYEDAKTLIKTNTNDDEAFAILNSKFAEASKKMTGKKPSAKEAEKWGMLADLLILELEVAASRADGVSSVPAFLTEVLRRQFFAARREGQQSASKSSKTKPDTVGKNEAGNYEIKPLDAQGREAALEQLREFANDDFLEDFKKWYTPEDWGWLTKELEK